MAKRQQVEDLNTSQAIQPVQQVTDSYISPGYFQMPQNEMIDIARSLAEFSPQLKQITGDLWEDMVERETEEGIAQVSTMTEEELEDALASEWRKQGLPDGASPYAQRAIRRHAGAMMARTSLEKWRIEQLDRFSDPYSTEDPREALQAHFETLNTGGFYASAAAAEEFNKQANVFSQQVYQVRAARTVKQNEDDYVDKVYEHLSNFPKTVDLDLGWAGMDINIPVTPSQINEWKAGLLEINNKHHTLTGKSGRDGMWKAIEMRAKQIAEDDEISAINFLGEVGSMKIAGQRLDYSFASEMDTLLDQIPELADAALVRDERRAQYRDRAETRTANEVIDQYLAEKIESEDLDLDQVDDDLRPKLEEAGVQNVSKFILNARATAHSQLRLGDESDRDTLEYLDSIRADFRGGSPTMTPDQFREEIRSRSDDLSPKDYRVFLDFADLYEDVKGQAGEATKRSRPELASSLNKIKTTMTTTMFEAGSEHSSRSGQVTDETSSIIEDELVRIRREMDSAIKAATSSGIELGHSDEQIDANVRAEIKRIEAEQMEAHTGTVPTTSPLRQITKKAGEFDPLVLTTPGTTWRHNDSKFARVVDDNRENIVSKIGTQREKAMAAVREAGQIRLEEFRGTRVASDILLHFNRELKIEEGKIGINLINAYPSAPAGQIVEGISQFAIPFVGVGLGAASKIAAAPFRGKDLFSPDPNLLLEYQAARSIGADPYTPDELDMAKTNGNLDQHGVFMPSDVTNPRRVLYFRNMDEVRGAADEYENAENKADTYIGRLIKHMPAYNDTTFLFTQSSLLGYQGTK